MRRNKSRNKGFKKVNGRLVQYSTPRHPDRDPYSRQNPPRERSMRCRACCWEDPDRLQSVCGWCCAEMIQ